MALKTLVFPIKKNAFDSFAFTIFNSLPEGWKRNPQNEKDRKSGECLLYCFMADSHPSADAAIWLLEDGSNKIKVEYDESVVRTYFNQQGGTFCNFQKYLEAIANAQA